MIKNFIQKHKAILITIIITAVITTAVASGYFVIKNEKEKANQKVESLQKSIEELQTKTENSVKSEEDQEANKEPEKDIPAPEATAQPTPTIKKSVEVAPTKVEVEEKTVSCLTYAKTTVQVSEAECDLIKQKNESSKEIDSSYQGCVSICGSVADACLPVVSRAQLDSVSGSGTYDSRVSGCRDKKDDCIQDCLEARNDQMKKLWK